MHRKTANIHLCRLYLVLTGDRNGNAPDYDPRAHFGEDRAARDDSKVFGQEAEKGWQDKAGQTCH